MIRARDIPMGLGDMDASLYLLFRAIREHSTVALSGESADEVFGGYLQFFDERARNADTFPWLVRFAEDFGEDSNILRDDLGRALDLEKYVRDSYETAVAGIERLAGESDFEFRMRKICYLHLTRFVRVLLDRKDRASMAVGLEVRVPFCDHRLVEYVYNAPWALKSFDGREKSLLREATADVLPRSVYDRTKSPYPRPRTPSTPRPSRNTPVSCSPARTTACSNSSTATGSARRSSTTPPDHLGVPPRPGTRPGPRHVAGHVRAGTRPRLRARRRSPDGLGRTAVGPPPS